MTGSDLAFFKRGVLFPLAEKWSGIYAKGSPFPHVVIDDFMPPSLLMHVLEEFPDRTDDAWRGYRGAAESKLELADSEGWGPVTRTIFDRFNSAAFVEFLERLTGIHGLIPDPHYEGGGLHHIERNGFLKVHADFNKHQRLQLDRRLNVLIYLNPDWQTSYGGALELWDPAMQHCVERIDPIFNRCVVFSTTSTSFHGHPEPLATPPGIARRSLALYYYTNGRPIGEWRRGHTTLFRSRPGESFTAFKHDRAYRRHQLLIDVTPPILRDLYRSLRHRRDSI